jgi:hypothetical protein
MRLDQVKTINECENCKHVFQGNLAKPIQIINVEPYKDIVTLLLAINGELYWSRVKQGDRALACPKCDTIHPVGFDTAPTGEQKSSIILDL